MLDAFSGAPNRSTTTVSPSRCRTWRATATSVVLYRSTITARTSYTMDAASDCTPCGRTLQHHRGDVIIFDCPGTLGSYLRFQSAAPSQSAQDAAEPSPQPAVSAVPNRSSTVATSGASDAAESSAVSAAPNPSTTAATGRQRLRSTSPLSLRFRPAAPPRLQIQQRQRPKGARCLCGLKPQHHRGTTTMLLGSGMMVCLWGPDPPASPRRLDRQARQPGHGPIRF